MLTILASAGFQEKALLLVMTAAVSGLLIPWVLRQVDARKSIEQKQREASIARQAKLIDAQAELLDSLARALWDWRYAAMRVTYYGAQSSAEDFATARGAYTTTIWTILSGIRFHTSRARWVISKRAFDRLIMLYHELIDLDLRLYRACELTDPVKSSLELGDLNQIIFGRITNEIDSLLESVATEAMLSTQSEEHLGPTRSHHDTHRIATIGTVQQNQSVRAAGGGSIGA